MLTTILWIIVALLVIFWIVGLGVNLGSLVWIALAAAVILAIVALLTRGRAAV